MQERQVRWHSVPEQVTGGGIGGPSAGPLSWPGAQTVNWYFKKYFNVFEVCFPLSLSVAYNICRTSNFERVVSIPSSLFEETVLNPL